MPPLERPRHHGIAARAHRLLALVGQRRHSLERRLNKHANGRGGLIVVLGRLAPHLIALIHIRAQLAVATSKRLAWGNDRGGERHRQQLARAHRGRRVISGCRPALLESLDRLVGGGGGRGGDGGMDAARLLDLEPLGA